MDSTTLTNTPTTDKTYLDLVEEAYGDLVAALVAEDARRLEELLVEECVIIGPKGFRIDKDEWVKTHSSRIYEQVELRSLESSTHPYYDAVVRDDLQRSECIFQGEHISGLFRVLTVWVPHKNALGLAAIQYTAVSPEAQSEEDQLVP